MNECINCKRKEKFIEFMEMTIQELKDTINFYEFQRGKFYEEFNMDSKKHKPILDV